MMRVSRDGRETEESRVDTDVIPENGVLRVVLNFRVKRKQGEGEFSRK